MTRRYNNITLTAVDGLIWASVDLMLVEVFMQALEKLPATADTKCCVIGRALTELAEPYRTALRDIVYRPWTDGGLTADEVAIVMMESGLRGSATAVTRHRRGTCVCNLKGE